MSDKVSWSNFLNHLRLCVFSLVALTELIHRESGKFVSLVNGSTQTSLILHINVYLAALSGSLTAWLLIIRLIEKLIWYAVAVTEDLSSLRLLHLITVILCSILLLSDFLVFQLYWLLIVHWMKIAQALYLVQFLWLSLLRNRVSRHL